LFLNYFAHITQIKHIQIRVFVVKAIPFSDKDLQGFENLAGQAVVFRASLQSCFHIYLRD